MPQFTIPATAFPQQGLYLVSLLVAKQGKVSGNAFLGSTALAATGAAGIPAGAVTCYFFTGRPSAFH